MNRYNFKFLPAIVIASAIGLYGCGNGKAESKKEAKAEAAPAPEAFKLQQGNLSSSIAIPGELVPYQQVDLYAKVSSFVKQLYVDVGSKVTAGQLLAVMEAPEMNAQIAAATSRLKSQEAVYLASKATYDRLLQTSKTPGTVSQNDLDVADARQKSDLAQLEAANASQREVTETNNYLQIRAPFSGIITARNVSAGAYVGPSGKGSDMPIFTLQEQKKLRLVVSVPDAFVGNLEAEGKVEFTVKAMPGQRFDAKIARQAGALDNRLRAQRTEMDVVNNDNKLLPGMIADVYMPLTSNNKVFVVPSGAVMNTTEGTYIIAVRDNAAVWIPVSTGRSDDENTEIFGELKDSEVVLAHASEEIRKESKLEKVNIR